MATRKRKKPNSSAEFLRLVRRKDGSDLRVQTRAAVGGTLSPATIDAAARTVEVVFTTGASVRRWDYLEELVVTPEALDLARLNDHASVLNTHSQWDLKDVIGVVERAWIEGGEGRAVIKMSARPEVEPIWQDIQSGIIRHISVGYEIMDWVLIETGDLPILRATKWQPSEISFVPVPADAGAGVRSNPVASGNTSERKSKMKNRHQRRKEAAQKKTQPQAAPVVDTRAASQRAVEFERTRVREITSAVRAAGLDQSVADDLVARGVSLNGARSEVLKALAAKSDGAKVKGNRRNSGRAEIIRDETDTRREGVVEMLLARANPAKHKISEKAQAYRSLSLMDIARQAVEASGVRTATMSRPEIAQRALTTADIPHITGSVVRRTLRDAYAEAPQTYMPLVTVTTAPDFRDIGRVSLTGAPNMLPIAEGAEYQDATLGDGKEVYRVTKFGRVIPITWETFVNDDLNALGRLPALFGRAFRDNESDLVWGQIISNPNMADGVPVFHADHDNLLDAEGINEAGLSAAEIALMEQTGPDGQKLALAPRYLATSVRRKMQAQKMLAASVSTKATDVNTFTNAYELIIEPRLAATNTPWYLAAGTDQGDLIELAYLDGAEGGILIDEQFDFDRDTLKFKARQVAGAKIIDYRLIVKNPGHSTR